MSDKSDKELDFAIMEAIVGDDPISYTPLGKRKADKLKKFLLQWRTESLLKMLKKKPDGGTESRLDHFNAGWNMAVDEITNSLRRDK